MRVCHRHHHNHHHRCLSFSAVSLGQRNRSVVVVCLSLRRLKRHLSLSVTLQTTDRLTSPWQPRSPNDCRRTIDGRWVAVKQTDEKTTSSNRRNLYSGNNGSEEVVDRSTGAVPLLLRPSGGERRGRGRWRRGWHEGDVGPVRECRPLLDPGTCSGRTEDRKPRKRLRTEAEIRQGRTPTPGVPLPLRSSDPDLPGTSRRGHPDDGGHRS